jgi:hypothetical protein
VPNWNDICLRRCQSECLRLSNSSATSWEALLPCLLLVLDCVFTFPWEISWYTLFKMDFIFSLVLDMLINCSTNVHLVLPFPFCFMRGKIRSILLPSSASLLSIFC